MRTKEEQIMNYKFDGAKVFFTSDTHFNHANIIDFCSRPFKNVNEMNETLITNWNRVVGADDIVFHLGDFCLGGSAEWTNVLNRLNGKIYLNHCPFLCYGGAYKDTWQLFGHVHTSKNNTGKDASRLNMLFPTQYDVGVDNNNFTPVSFDQVKAIIQKQVEQFNKNNRNGNK